jgi:hypothetical protein
MTGPCFLERDFPLRDLDALEDEDSTKGNSSSEELSMATVSSTLSELMTGAGRAGFSRTTREGFSRGTSTLPQSQRHNAIKTKIGKYLLFAFKIIPKISKNIYRFSPKQT